MMAVLEIARRDDLAIVKKQVARSAFRLNEPEAAVMLIASHHTIEADVRNRFHRVPPTMRVSRSFKTSATLKVRNEPTQTQGSSPRSARWRIEFSLISSNRAAALVLIRPSIAGAFTIHLP
jgi:hypothetical protein